MQKSIFNFLYLCILYLHTRKKGINSLAVPQKVKHKVTICLRSSTSRYIPKGIKDLCLHKNLYRNVHSRITHNSQKMKNKMSINWCMDEQKVVYSYMEYHPATKTNKILMHATRWMNLEIIMLNERSQVQKAVYYMIPLTWNVQNRQIHTNRKQISGYQGLVKGEMGSDC